MLTHLPVVRSESASSTFMAGLCPPHADPSGGPESVTDATPHRVVCSRGDHRAPTVCGRCCRRWTPRWEHARPRPLSWAGVGGDDRTTIVFIKDNSAGSRTKGESTPARGLLHLRNREVCLPLKTPPSATGAPIQWPPTRHGGLAAATPAGQASPARPQPLLTQTASLTQSAKSALLEPGTESCPADSPSQRRGDRRRRWRGLPVPAAVGTGACSPAESSLRDSGKCRTSSCGGHSVRGRGLSRDACAQTGGAEGRGSRRQLPCRQGLCQ